MADGVDFHGNRIAAQRLAGAWRRSLADVDVEQPPSSLSRAWAWYQAGSSAAEQLLAGVIHKATAEEFDSRPTNQLVPKER